MEFGSGSGLSCIWRCASGWVGRPAPRLRFSTVNIEIVKRSDDRKGVVVLPRRWVVERTLSWFGRRPRLANDFENLAVTLGVFVALASIQLALRRLAQSIRS
jgi:transposase